MTRGRASLACALTPFAAVLVVADLSHHVCDPPPRQTLPSRVGFNLVEAVDDGDELGVAGELRELCGVVRQLLGAVPGPCLVLRPQPTDDVLICVERDKLEVNAFTPVRAHLSGNLDRAFAR